MARRPPNVNIFNYTDYRVFLRDWYGDKKKNQPGFSYRSFARAAGFQSPNFGKLVMDGGRNLTRKSIGPFMKGLRLNKQEREFFRHLVSYTQAKTQETKNRFYEQMLRTRQFTKLKPLEKKQYEFMSTWYHPVVREFVISPHFDGTPESIAAHLQPPITVGQARQSLRLLERLGLIRRTHKGKWEQSDAAITTGAELKSRALVKYHQGLLELAQKQLTAVPGEKRDVSSLTMGVQDDQVPILKEKIRAFRRELAEFLAGNIAPKRIYLLNIQFLPVVEPEEGGPL